MSPNRQGDRHGPRCASGQALRAPARRLMPSVCSPPYKLVKYPWSLSRAADRRFGRPASPAGERMGGRHTIRVNLFTKSGPVTMPGQVAVGRTTQGLGAIPPHHVWRRCARFQTWPAVMQSFSTSSRTEVKRRSCVAEPGTRASVSRPSQEPCMPVFGLPTFNGTLPRWSCLLPHSLAGVCFERSVVIAGQVPPGTDLQTSATTGLDNVPMPLISISQASPGFMFCERPSVPIQIMSPGSSVR